MQGACYAHAFAKLAQVSVLGLLLIELHLNSHMSHEPSTSKEAQNRACSCCFEPQQLLQELCHGKHTYFRSWCSYKLWP